MDRDICIYFFSSVTGPRACKVFFLEIIKTRLPLTINLSLDTEFITRYPSTLQGDSE